MPASLYPDLNSMPVSNDAHPDSAYQDELKRVGQQIKLKYLKKQYKIERDLFLDKLNKIARHKSAALGVQNEAVFADAMEKARQFVHTMTHVIRWNNDEDVSASYELMQAANGLFVFPTTRSEAQSLLKEPMSVNSEAFKHFKACAEKVVSITTAEQASNLNWSMATAGIAIMALMACAVALTLAFMPPASMLFSRVATSVVCLGGSVVTGVFSHSVFQAHRAPRIIRDFDKSVETNEKEILTASETMRRMSV